MRIAGVERESVVDGEGIRFVVFTQGCPHHCPGCHNPETHDPLGGRIVSVGELLRQIDSDPLLDGLTLSGGEPFQQVEECAALAEAAHRRGLSVWCWTGYTMDELRCKPGAELLLAQVDVLVDGPFIEAQRTLDLSWRGSKNQRIWRRDKNGEVHASAE